MGSIGNKNYTKAYLEDRLTGLNEVVKILDQEKIPYRIAAGTLLGFYRDNAFIPWDNDVDIFFNVDDIYKKKDNLIKIFKKKKFELILTNKITDYSCFGFRAIKYGTRYEFSGFHEKGKYMMLLPKWNIGWKYPKDLFNSLSTIKFRNYEYTTFSNIEDFLILQYGNWKQPKKTRYLTYKVRTNYFNPFIRIVMKVKYFIKLLKNKVYIQS